MKLLFTLNATVPFPVNGAYGRFVLALCIQHEVHDNRALEKMDPFSLS